ncbi:hypothetical protein Tco_0003815 [Tanacetum coccineum]
MEPKDTLSSCSNSEEQQMQQIPDIAKESCMVSFRQLHSRLKLLSNNDLKGTRTECGFKRAFATLFGQDVETSTGTILQLGPERQRRVYVSVRLSLALEEKSSNMMLYGGGGISFQLKSDSLLHAHAQTTKTYYKHQDSRIKKAQELKTKTSANSDIK